MTTQYPIHTLTILSLSILLLFAAGCTATHGRTATPSYPLSVGSEIVNAIPGGRQYSREMKRMDREMRKQEKVAQREALKEQKRQQKILAQQKKEQEQAAREEERRQAEEKERIRVASLTPAERAAEEKAKKEELEREAKILNDAFEWMFRNSGTSSSGGKDEDFIESCIRNPRVGCPPH